MMVFLIIDLAEVKVRCGSEALESLCCDVVSDGVSSWLSASTGISSRFHSVGEVGSSVQC